MKNPDKRFRLLLRKLGYKKRKLKNGFILKKCFHDYNNHDSLKYFYEINETSLDSFPFEVIFSNRQIDPFPESTKYFSCYEELFSYLASMFCIKKFKIPWENGERFSVEYFEKFNLSPEYIEMLENDELFEKFKK